MAARSLCPRLDPCVSVAGLLRFLHPDPNGKRPTLIGDPALDTRGGFCCIDLLEDFGLLGIVCDGLVKALGPLFKPCGAVMPNESVVSGKRSVCGINHLPGLSALGPEPDVVDHTRSRMITTLLGKAPPAMILSVGLGPMRRLPAGENDAKMSQTAHVFGDT